MRIGAFEVKEPIPELKNPHVLAILRPWIDVNNVGSLTLEGLEAQLGARELARFIRPGNFFDFTRYRPVLYFEGHARRIKIPNVTISYALREKGNDFLFLHLLEPHSLSEVYVESVLRLFQSLQVKRYCLLGSMYDAVPHTKPLLVSGRASGIMAERDLKRAGVEVSNYQGPSTITYLITHRAPHLGIETMTLIVSLPQYVSLDEDYLGKVRLMEILNLLYDIPIDKKDFEKAARQRSLLNQKVETTPELKKVIPQLEAVYGLRVARKEGEAMPGLSPEMEEIFWESDSKDIGKA
ncbi:MAG: PAC2 family protein [Thermodesulfobacteriota bacterium]